MAFKAKLNFEGKEYDVLYCKYSLKRDVDSKGRPASDVYGGIIHIDVESTSDVTILDKMANGFKATSGSIVFKKSAEESKMKELSWENVYIIGYDEEIDVVGSKPMHTSFVVSAKKISMDAAQVEQAWPEE